MAIFHCQFSVISRGKGKSSVGASAYRSGEKIYNERDGIQHDYTKKVGVVYKEILTPENAPDWAKNRTKLWNEVERSETRSNSRTAREINIALPKELNREQQIELLKGYVKDNFISKGMIADMVIHDKADGNPHAHVMLTTREINQDGFTKKNRDWDKRENVDKWREQWAKHANKTLEKANVKEYIDHRSYEEQGIEKVATIHEGYKVRAMEKRGIETEIGNYNRQVADKNKMLELVERQLNIYERQRGELENGRFEVNGVRNEFIRGQGNNQDIGAKIIFGNRSGTNSIHSSRGQEPITTNEGHVEAIQGGQSAITKETSRKRGREKETYNLNQSDIETGIDRNIKVKRDELQENRGSIKDSITGNQKEPRQSQGIDKKYNGFSVPRESIVKAEDMMVGKDNVYCN